MQGKLLPPDLLRSLQTVKGFNEATFVEVHESGTQVVSVRFNPLKIPSGYSHIFPGSTKIPWSSFGYYLPQRPSFTLDPLLHSGAYYVQEASGMFIEQCLSQTTDLTKSVRVLDVCAAPGGKSTLIQSLISRNSLLVSNEVIRARVNIVIENLSKWGGENVIVTSNDPADLRRLENFFDVMIVDAPCSGSGLFRRDPAAISEWSADAVKICSLRQQRILADAYPALRKDGLLIYSTCSYSVSENEDICDWLCQHYDVSTLKLNVPPEWNIVETISEVYKAAGYRFFPDRLDGEGFFVACFRKNDGEENYQPEIKKSRLTQASQKESAIIDAWLKESLEVNLFHTGKEIFAFPRILRTELEDISANFYIKKAGVPVGKLVREEFLPAHELALSGLVSDKLFTVSLKKEDALQYLRKEEVTLNTDLKGWAMVQYEGQNLGWMKILLNRANNYYPREWRILKSGNN